MADESQYSDTTPPSLKRKYDDQSAAAADSVLTAGIELAKQKAQEVAARLLNNAPLPPTTDPSKRSKPDNGFDSVDLKAQYPVSTFSPSVGSYGHQGAASKKIDIPNGVSSKQISLSKAAKILSKFVSADNGASQVTSAYLHRASDAFNELKHLHKELKGEENPRDQILDRQIIKPLNFSIVG
ncbi:unnamed protein product [Lupinus luteus]|uniref:Uncharacterized protein n=1 Tax=Lupinus luteus TaxID=3873 RepID=A0AAV1XQU3_LUPLU